MEFDYILRVGLENGQEDIVRSPVQGAKTIEEASKIVNQGIVNGFVKAMENKAVFTLTKHDEGAVISWNTKYVTRFATQVVDREVKKDD